MTGVQSLVCLALGAGLIAASFASSLRARAGVAAAVFTTLFIAAVALPLDRSLRMGDYGTYTSSRHNFDTYMGKDAVRFEAHLSTTALRLIDRRLGATSDTPAVAFGVLGGLAAAWYTAMLLVATWAGGWSPAAVRYAGLSVAAPATLMYFGYRELGYLSLNAAAFPLIAAGLKGAPWRFEAGCALSGLGAALHGFGLVALAGAAAAAMAAPLRLRERARFVLHAFAFGTSTYLIWVFVYIVGMDLTIIPGHTESIPWRPLLVSTLAEHRVNHPIVSSQGSAEILAMSWIAGMPLLALVPAAVRRGALDVGPVLGYALPSVVFVCAFWPVQGIAVDGDLIFAAFPAVYALTWLAAQHAATTWISLVLLATSHVVFWGVMLTNTFVNSRVY